MLCQEAAFVQARCRIEIDEALIGPGISKYTARLYVLEDGDRVLRPLAFSSGQRAEVKATSEPLALTSAITYLESRFGAQTEYVHACLAPNQATRIGEPFIVGS